MFKPLLSRFLFASLALAFVSTSLAQSRRGYVRLTRIGPTVQVKDNATQEEIMRLDAQPTEEIRILEKNTVITVGEGSRVILVFSNGATISVKEGSILNIESYRQNPFAGAYQPATATEEPPADSHTRIRLEYGELVGNVKTLRPDSTFTVETPAGAAGIRGTTFRVVFRPQGNGQAFFSVTTLEGDVGVTTTEGTVNAPISVVDDQEVVILVEVNDDTGEVTVVTPIDEIAPANADPQTLADMSAAVQESAEAVVDVVITAENSQDETTPEDEATESEEDEAEEDDSEDDGSEDDGSEDDDSEEDSQESEDDAEAQQQEEDSQDDQGGDESESTDSANEGGDEGDGTTPTPPNGEEGSGEQTTGEGEGDGDGSNQPAPENGQPTTQPVDNADQRSPNQGIGG